jgi:phosphotransferase system HPr-like phosphotransfer protein
MYEIISSDVKIEKKLTMSQIMSLYQQMKNYDGNIFFLKDHKLVDASKLSKLVSFMLTVDEATRLKVVIEGKDVKKLLEKVEHCFQQTEQQAKSYKFYVNPTKTVQI